MPNLKYDVVTTFHKPGLEKYADSFIKSFLKNWPSQVTLYAYAENCQVTTSGPNLIVKDLHTECPDLVVFKEKWKNVPKANGDVSNDPVRSKRKDAGKGFKWDAVRFSNKVYAICQCALESKADVLIWMDADMICHSPISLDKINMLIPENIDLCYLGREGKFSECGLYSMNLRSPRVIEFLRQFKLVYDDAENGIFTLEEWHDSYVFDQVRKVNKKLIELDWSKGIINGEGHPLINSAWGAYLDHLKGKRKDYGKSLKTDLITNRTERYWQ